ncbi:protein kinase [Rubripirellula amarantea]|nr:protein kinase [Rubripirellula amarantea]
MSSQEPFPLPKIFDSQTITHELSDSLLGAIQRNPRLEKRLGQMPADEKTIAWSSDSVDDFSHPDLDLDLSTSTPVMSPSDLSETVDFSVDEPVPTTLPIDMGFVPLRQITSVGSGSRDDADYRLVGKLGAGGTAVVFQAHQRAVDREVAVKMLRSELALKPTSRERFLTEARVIGGLDHPNVIALHEVYADQDGSLFYSMKRIDGTSWDKQIGEYTLDQNIETLFRVADAIRYAHSRGLIHRDIKPENVMLGRFGEVLLADWGLAIHHLEQSSNAEASRSIGGTPAYMAPELASAAAGSITFQTDVYLLGAILYQILTGYPPHRGESLLECIVAASNNVIEPSEIEGEMMEIAMKAMATDPKNRFHDVDEFVAAIKNQRKHEQSQRLVRRAVRRVEGMENSDHNGDVYRDFGIADALLAEAIEEWPENEKAHVTRKRLQLKLAAIATERGDYDLAANLYEAAGEGESDEAEMVQFHRMRRDASQQQVSRYSVLFTQSPDPGLLVQMKSAKIVEANLAFAEMFGYSGDEVVGQRISDLNLWVSTECQKKLVEAVKRDGSVDDFGAELLHTDGHHIDVLINARIVEVLGETMLLSTMRDISLRKKAERELKASQSRLRDLQRMAGLATWSYDVESQKVKWNNEAFLLAGRSLDEGTPTREELFEMVHPDDRARLQEALELAIQTGAAYELSVRQRGGDGEYVWVRVRGQPILNESGKAVEVFGVFMERPQRSKPRDT